MPLLRTLFVSLLTTLLLGCVPSDPPPTDAEVVEFTWELVDQRYALFEDKPDVNWADAKGVGLERLNAGDDLFDALEAMLAPLRDGHTNLIGPADTSWDIERYRAARTLYDDELVARDVLGYEFQRRGGVRAAVIPNTNVGYLRISDFDSIPGEETMEALFIDFQQRDALIIDLRDNGGGSLSEMFRLSSRIALEASEGYAISFKAGPEHNALTERETRPYEPSSGARFEGPVAVLVDRRSYSAANTFAFLSQDRATLVGDRTGGGGSIPTWFELPNGWKLRLSTSRMTMPDSGEAMEPGIEPDVPAVLDPQARSQGRDSVIEAALDVL